MQHNVMQASNAKFNLGVQSTVVEKIGHSSSNLKENFSLIFNPDIHMLNNASRAEPFLHLANACMVLKKKPSHNYINLYYGLLGHSYKAVQGAK